MNLEFEADDVAVVFGGANGIGFACGQRFASEGLRVALVDINSAVIESANQICQSFNRDSIGLVSDVTDYNAMKDSVDEVRQKLGGCHHVVFAAGLGSGKYGFPFWNLAPKDWRKVLDVNLIGAVNVAHACAPFMIQQHCGSFLFVSSIAGQIGSQTDPPYSAAKAAVINFAQCAAKDFAEHDVRVNTICPGMVKTKLNQSVWQAWNDQQPENKKQSYDEWAEDKIRRVTPLRRWQTPNDIAKMAIFLASPAATNITGQTINVDGGQVMHW